MMEWDEEEDKIKSRTGKKKTTEKENESSYY